jgi:uncharacterized protein YaaW (UPF0174 family)
LFFKEINEFLNQTKSNFKKKILVLGFLILLFLIIFFSLIIALSEIFVSVLSYLLLLSPIIFGILVFLKIRKSDVRKFLKFIQDTLSKIDDLLQEKKEKENYFKTLNPQRRSFKEILSFANNNEIETLEKFSGIKYKSLEQFELAIRKKSTNDISSLLKRFKGVDKSLTIASYSDMIDLAAKNFKLKRDTKNDADLEKYIISTQFEKMIKKMDKKDREVLELEITKIAEEKFGKKNLNLVLSSSGILAANLGGFATYTMATSLLGGISSALGVVLPFAAYTTLTSAISVALGPLGVGALSLWGVHKLTSANIKSTILVVLEIAAIRERLTFEREENLKILIKEIEELEVEKLNILKFNDHVINLSENNKYNLILFSNRKHQNLINYTPSFQEEIEK